MYFWLHYALRGPTSPLQNEGKGVIIAEGDILTLCIRLFSEILQERYTVPLPAASSSLLASHAVGLIEENKLIARSIHDHRSDSFNSLILPQSQPVIEAIGHAMAYSAARDAKLPQHILDVYECSVIRQDSAWYSENAGLNRMAQRLREDAVVTAALPHLEACLDALHIENYVSAPIVTDAEWKTYVASLPTYSGNAVIEPGRMQRIQAVL